MDLIQLEVFCAVFKNRSFSLAAEALGLSQPTVSIRIKEFEESLGTPLFNRLGRDIEPTDAGTFLYQQALPLLAQQRQLSGKMAAFLNRVDGPLVVGTSSAPGEYLLPGFLMAFQSSHPDVHVKLRFFGNSEQTLTELRSGGIELGVILAAQDSPEVIMEPFAADELVLITPADDKWTQRPRIPLAELATLPLIVLDTGSATRTTLDQSLALAGTRLSRMNVVAEFGRTNAIKEAVKEGHGVAFVSNRTITGELAAGTVRVAQVPELGRITRSFGIAGDRRRTLSPTARAFLDHLRRVAPGAAAAKPAPRSRRKKGTTA